MSIGCGSALGESVILGYLKFYPTALTGAWSSGTGMAGIGGSALYLLLAFLGLSNTAIFAMQVCTNGVCEYPGRYGRKWGATGDEQHLSSGHSGAAHTDTTHGVRHDYHGPGGQPGVTTR